MWLAPAALVLIVKRCFEPQASLLRRVDRAGRSGSGNGGSRCAFRSSGQRHRGSARCAGRQLLAQRRRRFRDISPEGRKFLKSEESRRCCDGRPEQNEVKPKFQDLIIAGFRCVLPSLRANFPTRAGELARYH